MSLNLDPQDRIVELDHVRDTAEAAGPVEIEPVVASSWSRSLNVHRIDPARPDAPTILTAHELKEFRQPLAELLDLARPELDDLYGLVGDLEYIVLFADRGGVVVDVRADQLSAKQCKNAGVWRGAVWTEEVEGTNGIGTCIHEGRPLTIHLSQHFRARHADLSCSAAPVFDPDGRLAGILDISSMNPAVSDQARALALPVTARAARAIEARWFRARFAGSRILRLTGKSRKHPAMTIAADDDMRIVGADRNARRALNLSDQDIRWGTPLSAYFERAQALFRPRRPAGPAVPLISRRGRAAWQVEVTLPRHGAVSGLAAASEPAAPIAASASRGGLSPAAAHRVLRYIDVHLAENIRLASLAAVAGVSVSHFARAFKQSTGMPAHRYVIKRRIARARELLADPALSLPQIALRLGFSDHSHFTRHFRRETGTTPALARQACV